MKTITVIRALIRESLLLEDRIQDLIDTDPSGNLLTARDMGVTHIGGLTWLKSMIDKRIVGDSGEPIADVVPVVVSFFKQGMSDRLNRAGLPTDIMRYKNPGELRKTIESLGASKGSQKKAVKQAETDVVYESDNFLVVMPRSTASACYYGKGTTWCTAATEGTNLFLTYVGSNRGVILYHILKKGSDSVKDPGSKINVATIKGKPYFSTTHGGLSVDAANNGLTEEKYNATLGDEAQPVLDAIVAHSAKLGNKHPAAKEVDAAVASLDAWKAKTDGFNAEVYNDFLSFAFKDREVGNDILQAALNDPRLSPNSKYYIYESPNFDNNQLIDILKTAENTTLNAAMSSLSSRKDITYDQIQQAIGVLKGKPYSDFHIARLYQNPAIPVEDLIKAYNEQSGSYLDWIAKNPNLPDEFIQEKIQEAVGPYTPSQPKSQNFIICVARSRPEHARQVWEAVKNSRVTSAGYTQVRFKVAQSIANASEDPDLLELIAFSTTSGPIRNSASDSARKDILRALVTNGTTPEHVIQELASNSDNTFIEMLARARLDDPNFNEEDVEELHKLEYPEEYEDDY